MARPRHLHAGAVVLPIPWALPAVASIDMPGKAYYNSANRSSLTPSLSKKEELAMVKSGRITVLVLLLLLALAVTAHASNGETTNEGPTNGQVALILAPLLAAATVIERVIEMGFSWFESIVISASTFLRLGGSYIQWAREQVEAARKALLSTSPTNPAAITAAEEALHNAEQRLKDWVQGEPYVSVKRGLSVLIGIILGIVVAWISRLQMFKMLGVNLISLSAAEANPALAQFLTSVDIFVTGLVIGTGSAPVHSLIGILQKSKEAIDQARALARARSYQALADFLANYAPPSKAPGAAPSALETERLARRLLG